MSLDVNQVRRRLPDRQIEWLQSTASTMLVAAEQVHQGSPHGTIIGAEQQTAGIGRHGKRWHSAPGEGLYVSIILRLKLKPAQLPIVTLALGLAAQEAIAETAGLNSDLRWPNDVLANGKKLGGILCQMEAGMKERAVIAGIGINVSQPEFPADLETPGTSLLLEGAGTAREDLLVALAQAVDDQCGLLEAQGAEPILRAFTAASTYAEGRRVTAEADGRRIMGTSCGLDATGFLRVREDSGRVVTILAGGVRIIPERNPVT